MIERTVRWMLTRWSPNTVSKLVELPRGGNCMKVALSCIMALSSSERSMTIQSSFRGRMAVSRETSAFVCHIPVRHCSSAQRRNQPS
jgi:hypothetical protein